MSSGNGSIAASQYAKVARKMPSTIVPNTWTPAGLIKPGIKVYVDPSLKKENKKEKKMGWFKKKFAKWVREAWENARDEDRTYTADSLRPHEGVNGKSSVRFTIYAAQGGHIIEYYKNDRYKEHDGPELVIVNGDQTIGQAVEHILTMEALKS